MKKMTRIFAAMAMSLLIASCGTVGTTATAPAEQSGTTGGQTAGAALKSLYGQYRTDSKVDLANMNNIISLAQLVNGVQGLKNVDDKSQFYSDFAAGLILGSQNLVTEQTSAPVTSALSTLVNGTDLKAIAAAGLAAAAQSQQAKQAQAQVQEAAGNVANKVEAISEKTAGVANTLSTLSSIFALFQAE